MAAGDPLNLLREAAGLSAAGFKHVSSGFLTGEGFIEETLKLQFFLKKMPVNFLFILQLGLIPAFTLRFKSVTKNVWEHKLKNIPPPPASRSQETPGSA